MVTFRAFPHDPLKVVATNKDAKRTASVTTKSIVARKS